MTEERQERTDIDKVIRSLTNAISEHGGDEGFYDRLAEQIPQAAKQARQQAQYENQFNDPNWLKAQHERYIQEIAEAGHQPNVVAKIKGQLRQQYGAKAELIFSHGGIYARKRQRW